MTSPVRIREFQSTDRDYEAIARIHNALFPDHLTSAAERHQRDAIFDTTKYVLKRYVAEEGESSNIVGNAVYHHTPWSFHPQRFLVWIGVEPNHQRRGIGSQLYAKLLEDLTRLHAVEIRTEARETMPATLAFLEKRGFREDMRSWESRLNVQEFDGDHFQEYLVRVAASGITITTLAQAKKSDPDWLQKVYELDMTLVRDVPSPTPCTPVPLEEYVREVIEDPNTLPDGHFIAKDGTKYIGESFVERSQMEPQRLDQGFTGVRREYRGRGIAMALKLKTIEYARQHSYAQIVTDNASVNEAMLAVNEKLGFVRQPAWIEFEKRMTGS